MLGLMTKKRPQWAEEMFGEMKLDLRALGVGLEEVRDDIKSLAEHQLGMEENIRVIRKDIVEIKEKLDRKTDVEETAKLERRVTALEKNPK